MDVSSIGLRSVFDRFPLQVRYFFVTGSIQVRSGSALEARAIEQLTEEKQPVKGLLGRQ